MPSTKDIVLADLINNESYLSGEKISTKLNISRAAVNTAVKALRADGYVIDSSTNKGYKLIEHPDKINSGELLAYLPEKRLETVACLDTVTSTNKIAKDLCYDGAPAGTVVVANHQSAGKGRLGRSFISPPNTGIYLSYLLRPTLPPDKISTTSTITAWAAVAVCNAIENACGIRPEIKWVNDVLINSMKVCGILTEMFVETESGLVTGIVIGIGINVNQKQTDFPPELQEIASSIAAQDGGTKYPRARIIVELIKELDRLASNWPQNAGEYLAMYRSSCVTIGKEVDVISVHTDPNEIPRRGFAVTINDDFSIRVRFNDGHEEDLSSGEVRVRGLYGYT
ncbi:MAG: biotin--[acetyl-CoA-carboxylase] ligase [Saccharofermentans sp.]|nr:biotin--[acetyl-CoA-carboxylase] ligase [Saccharofermentans sp.]